MTGPTVAVPTVAVLKRALPRASGPGLVAALLLSAIVASPCVADSSAGAEVFANRCAVCHGPQAAGIPGSFPSLHEQIVAFAKIPQGRDYLVMVVTTGLMGALKVAGVSYNGVMPAQSGLSEAEVAAVLNYLAGDLGKNDLGASALSAADVSDARARHPDKSAQATRALRPRRRSVRQARQSKGRSAAVVLAAVYFSVCAVLGGDATAEITAPRHRARRGVRHGGERTGRSGEPAAGMAALDAELPGLPSTGRHGLDGHGTESCGYGGALFIRARRT